MTVQEKKETGNLSVNDDDEDHPSVGHCWKQS